MKVVVRNQYFSLIIALFYSTQVLFSAEIVTADITARVEPVVSDNMYVFNYHYYLADKEIAVHKLIYDDSNHLITVNVSGQLLPDTLVRAYTRHDKLHSELTIKDNMLTGFEKEYTENGMLFKHNNVKNYRRNGVCTTFFVPSGKINKKVNFVDDKRDGLSMEYYDNSSNNVREVILYKDNKELSVKAYRETGSIESEKFYLDGKLQGTALSYYDNASSNIKEKIVYEKGRMVAKQEYLENGALSKESHFKDEKLHGIYRKYYPLNKGKQRVETEILFNNGSIVSEKNYDLNGRLIFKCDYKDGKRQGNAIFIDNKGITQNVLYEQGEIQLKNEYYSSGKIKLENIKNENSLRKNEYYESGIKKTSKEYKAGMPTGIWKYYYDIPVTENRNEFIMEEQTYDDNGYLQSRRSYFSNGKISGEEYYKDGLPEGIWLRFNDVGEVTQKNIYKNGNEYYESGEIKVDKVVSQSIVFEKYYSDNGEIQKEIQYTDGRPCGVWRYYAVGQEKTSINAVITGNAALDKLGRVLSQEIQYSDQGQRSMIKDFHPNGKIKQVSYFSKDGNPSGVWKIYDDSGAVISTKSFVVKNTVKKVAPNVVYVPVIKKSSVTINKKQNIFKKKTKK